MGGIHAVALIRMHLPVAGSVIESEICTSPVEKQNQTLRMDGRRCARLTRAFSKKLENFKAAVALNFAYYNFVKLPPVMSPKTTVQAAMVSGEQK